MQPFNPLMYASSTFDIAVRRQQMGRAQAEVDFVLHRSAWAAIAFGSLLFGGLALPCAAETMPQWSLRAAIHISRFVTYPARVRHFATSRVAVVNLLIDRNGRVSGPRIVVSTGIDELDRAALVAVERSDPVPSPPLPAQKAKVDARLPIRFNPRYVQSGISATWQNPLSRLPPKRP